MMCLLLVAMFGVATTGFAYDPKQIDARVAQGLMDWDKVVTNSEEIIAKADGRTPPAVGANVRLGAQAENMHVFDAGTGEGTGSGQTLQGYGIFKSIDAGVTCRAGVQEMSPNQFEPFSFLMPASQNSQNRMARRASGHR